MNMQTKGRFDPDSPAIKAYERELAHQFVREGTMVAFPTCLPGMTTPIVHDECHITALDIDADGQVYGGTSGRRAHLFAARFHDLTGVVLDVGVAPEGTSSVAVCCGKSRTVAFVNGARGGRAIAIPQIDLAQDWIQEWGLNPSALQDLGECVAGEPIVHAISNSERNTIVGITAHHLFTMDIESGKIAVVGEVPGRGRLAMANSGVFGQDDGARLWHFELASGKIRRAALDLPHGEWSGALHWARSRDQDQLLTADSAGQLFAFDGKEEFRLLGKAHLAPVGPMAQSGDGRVFGFCGTGISNLFCCDSISGSMSNLGVAASVFEKRRYGYEFGDAITGPDGEIIFGEDDNDGHLWIYFPKVRRATRAGA